jgi:hypothetical protein
MDNSKLFPTRQQPVNTLQEGQGFDDGKLYNLRDYKKMADDFYTNWISTNHPDLLVAESSSEDNKSFPIPDIDLEILAKDYWNIVETNNRSVVVEYGNDIDTHQYGSGFPKHQKKNITSSFTSVRKVENDEEEKENMNNPYYYSTTNWNLNNIPSAPGSLLKYLKTEVTGINVPWLYIGMLFATFCWHTEDNYFYSINYSHYGSSKQWYGIPGSDANTFEKVSTISNRIVCFTFLFFLLIFMLVSLSFSTVV